MNVFLYAEPAMIRSGLGLLLNGVPEAETVQAAGSLAELEALSQRSAGLPEGAIWVVYQNDAATLERIGPYLGEPRGFLIIRDEGQEAGMDPRGLAPAWGIVSTRVSPEALRAAMLAVSQGLNVLEANLDPGQEAIFSSPLPGEEPFDPLTERELDVLRKIAQGLTNKKIALELGISENTVKFHISAIFSKINASSRTDAVRRGARLGLLAL